MPVAVVVVDERCNWFEIVGMAVRSVSLAMLAAPDIVEVPLQIAENEQIQESVIV